MFGSLTDTPFYGPESIKNQTRPAVNTKWRSSGYLPIKARTYKNKTMYIITRQGTNVAHNIMGWLQIIAMFHL